MNKSYDVYMCKELPPEADARRLEAMLRDEKYAAASVFLTECSKNCSDYKRQFCNSINNRPDASPLKSKIILDSIRKILNRELRYEK